MNGLQNSNAYGFRIPPVVNAQVTPLEGIEKFDRNSLDAPDLGGRQSRLVLEGRTRPVIPRQDLPHGPAIFLVHITYELQQVFKRFLDGRHVILAVVPGYNPFVRSLEVGAQRVLLKRALKPLLDDRFEILHGGPLRRAALELPAKPVPEHARLAVPALAVTEGLEGSVDTRELMIGGGFFFVSPADHRRG